MLFMSFHCHVSKKPQLAGDVFESKCSQIVVYFDIYSHFTTTIILL
jgi:hypothetical protein